MKQLILLVLISLLIYFKSSAQIVLDSTTLSVTTVAQNLDTPWEMLWGPDDKIWFTERVGKVSRIDPDTENVELLLEISEVHEESESGLLGMALHPNFSHPDSQFVFLVYTYNAPALTEKLVRYTLETDKLASPVVLLDGIPAHINHDGSRLIITSDRKIMMTTGDAQNPSLAQNTGSLAGKVLRLNLDGTIPDDNPIAGSPIWSIGHRNPQGLVEAPNGTVYSSEHGPANDDEINVIKRNANYGWPDVQGFCNFTSEQAYCNEHDITEPLSAWTPTLAVAGIDYYHHEAIPEWSNAILLTTLKEDDFRVLRLNNSGNAIVDEKIYFNNSYGRLRDVCISPDGDIYLSTSNRDTRANDGFPIASDDRIIRLSNDNFQVITALEEAKLADERVRLYPNPAVDHIQLQVPYGTLITIQDLKGRKVLQIPYQSSVDVSSIAPGTYILSFVSGNRTGQRKFIKR